MAIEIREVVVRATVNKSIGTKDSETVTRAEMHKMQEKMMARILSRVRDMIQEERSLR
jgi:hypothetical protein